MNYTCPQTQIAIMKVYVDGWTCVDVAPSEYIQWMKNFQNNSKNIDFYRATSTQVHPST